MNNTAATQTTLTPATATVSCVPILSDNYVWILHQSLQSQGSDENTHATLPAVVVDPGEVEPVLEYLKAHGLHLDTILITHHHNDHTGGIGGLQAAYPDCRIVVPATEKDNASGTEYVNEGEKIDLLGLPFTAIHTPGHTLGHMVFFNEDTKILFAGDTLFAMGCGRLFEGTPEDMYSSFQKLRKLPEDTACYCAHEYTENNLKFVEQLPATVSATEQRRAEVTALRQAGKPTVPMSLASELETNPFFLVDNEEYRQQFDQGFSSALEAFTHIRALRNEW